MTTKNKIKLEFTKKEIEILVNALDILRCDLSHSNLDLEESVRATAEEKKYFKQITKLLDFMVNTLHQADEREAK